MRHIIILILLLVSPGIQAKSESDWVNQHCSGVIEYRLQDNTRVDCLTPWAAIEYDWPHKWAEGIGQALHYGLMTGRASGLVLITTDPKQCRFYQRANRIGMAIQPRVYIMSYPVACE